MTNDTTPPSDEEYQQEVIELMSAYCPHVYPCMKCHHPVLSGYCCGHCGDSEPDQPMEMDAEMQRRILVEDVVRRTRRHLAGIMEGGWATIQIPTKDLQVLLEEVYAANDSTKLHTDRPLDP